MQNCYKKCKNSSKIYGKSAKLNHNFAEKVQELIKNLWKKCAHSVIMVVEDVSLKIQGGIKMLKRIIEKDIYNWLENGKNALLIDGARQVGKTYTIRHCLETKKLDYIELNLIQNEDALRALAVSRSVEDLRINISAVVSRELIPGKTILFIDEVQKLEEIITLIKSWVDEGSFRYILSGSLLGVELKAIRSAPVGYVSELKMFPMGFEEFMEASGVTDTVITHLKECFGSKQPVGEVVHSKMMALFKRYLVVGGMPQAVNEYVESGNISRVGEIQRDIINYYKKDFTRYEDSDNTLKLTTVYDLIPSELLKQNRRFNYADIRKGMRFESVENSFVWLYKAGVVLHAFNATEPVVGLKMNEKSSLVKLYYSDVGLLTYSYGEAVRKNILFEDTVPNLGGVYENAVLQELVSCGHKVYYYNSKKLGELDFLIEYGVRPLPIEVKSGKDYYVHSAINNVLKAEGFGIKEAVVFTGYDLSVDENVTYYPVYMAGFLRENGEETIVEPISFL